MEYHVGKNWHCLFRSASRTRRPRSRRSTGCFSQRVTECGCSEARSTRGGSRGVSSTRLARHNLLAAVESACENRRYGQTLMATGCQSPSEPGISWYRRTKTPLSLAAISPTMKWSASGPGGGSPGGAGGAFCGRSNSGKRRHSALGFGSPVALRAAPGQKRMLGGRCSFNARRRASSPRFRRSLRRCA